MTLNEFMMDFKIRRDRSPTGVELLKTTYPRVRLEQSRMADHFWHEPRQALHQIGCNYHVFAYAGMSVYLFFNTDEEALAFKLAVEK